MQYLRLEKIQRPVSRLLFGCAFPAMIAGEDQSALLDKVFEAGITAVDTAENYGKSELVLGAWMASRGNREQITILTKGCHPYGHPRVDRENMRHDFYQSLERLRTDYVDVYMLHRDDPDLSLIHISRLVIQESLNEDRIGGLVRMMRWVIFSALSIEGIGAILLSTQFVPIYGLGKGIWYGVFHSIRSKPALQNAEIEWKTPYQMPFPRP